MTSLCPVVLATGFSRGWSLETISTDVISALFLFWPIAEKTEKAKVIDEL